MKYKKQLSILLTLVLCAICISTGTRPVLAASSTAVTVRLKQTTGNVTVKNASGKVIKARKDMKLYSGYIITTSAKSYAYITLDSAKAIKMDSISKLEVRKSGKKLDLLVKYGSLFFNVKVPLGKDEEMNVKTSTMAMGIRGTSGIVKQYSDKEKSYSEVQLYDGKAVISVTNPSTQASQTSTIEGGQSQTVILNNDKTISIEKSDLKTNSSLIPGFAAQEIKADKSLAEKIEEKSGLDVETIIKEADTSLIKDEQKAEEKKQEIEKEKEEKKEDDKQIIYKEEPKEDPSNNNGGGSVTPSPEKDAPLLICTASKGTVTGTTSLNALPQPGNKLVYKITQSLITNVKENKELKDFTDYTSAQNIETSLGSYVTLYEVTVQNKVHKYKSIQITTSIIKEPQPLVFDINIYTNSQNRIDVTLPSDNLEGYKFYALSTNGENNYDQIIKTGINLDMPIDNKLNFPSSMANYNGSIYIYSVHEPSKTYAISSNSIMLDNNKPIVKLFGYEPSYTLIPEQIRTTKALSFEFNEEIQIDSSISDDQVIMIITCITPNQMGDTMPSQITKSEFQNALDGNKLIFKDAYGAANVDYKVSILNGAINDMAGNSCNDLFWNFQIDGISAAKHFNYQIDRIKYVDADNDIIKTDANPSIGYRLNNGDGLIMKSFFNSLDNRDGEILPPAYNFFDFYFDQINNQLVSVMSKANGTVLSNTLTIPEHIKFIVNTQVLFDSSSTIINHGTILNTYSDGNISGITNLGNVQNYGIIDNTGSINNRGTIKNYGEIKSKGIIDPIKDIINSGIIENYGSVELVIGLINEGTLHNYNASNLIIPSGAVFTNKGQLIFDGITHTPIEGSLIIDTGTLKVNGTLTTNSIKIINNGSVKSDTDMSSIIFSGVSNIDSTGYTNFYESDGITPIRNPYPSLGVPIQFNWYSNTNSGIWIKK